MSPSIDEWNTPASEATERDSPEIISWGTPPLDMLRRHDPTGAPMSSKGSGEAGPLVSVVIPAFNAEATLVETLQSARAQTYANLEIIIVDDGSTDSTCALVDAQASADTRVKLVRQANAGVAAARNTGIAAASGEYVAPLDADDIWHPEKIELQLAAFDQASADTALVYTWSATIDAQSRVVGRPQPTYSGWVLPRLALSNFVGNGSSPLIRMSALREAGGYDPTLRARGGQGSEDRKLYLQIAERYRFAVVPKFLTGYRVVAGNMSSDVMQMLRSQDLVNDELAASHPELKRTLHQSRNRLSRYMLGRALKERRIAAAATLIRTMSAHDPLFTLRSLATLSPPGAWLRNLVRSDRERAQS